MRLTSRARVLEPLIIIILAYLAYIFAELVHWSGIISLVACGIFQACVMIFQGGKRGFCAFLYVDCKNFWQQRGRRKALARKIPAFTCSTMNKKGILSLICGVENSIFDKVFAFSHPF